MHEMLTQLKLARIREIHAEWLDRAAETHMPYTDFLRGLLQEELLAREENQVRRRLKDAAFPFEKTLEEFDFRLRPELNRQVILRYLDDRFLTQGRALVLIGPAGLGKTHLAVSIGLAMLKRGYTVRFTTVQALLTRVLRAGVSATKCASSLRSAGRVCNYAATCCPLNVTRLALKPRDSSAGGTEL